MKMEPSQMRFVPYKRALENFLINFIHLNTETDGHLWTRKGALTRYQICQHCKLDFPVSTIMRNTFLLFISHPVYGILLGQPECTKILDKDKMCWYLCWWYIYLYVNIWVEKLKRVLLFKTILLGPNLWIS